MSCITLINEIMLMLCVSCPYSSHLVVPLRWFDLCDENSWFVSVIVGAARGEPQRDGGRDDKELCYSARRPSSTWSINSKGLAKSILIQGDLADKKRSFFSQYSLFFCLRPSKFNRWLWQDRTIHMFKMSLGDKVRDFMCIREKWVIFTAARLWFRCSASSLNFFLSFSPGV